MSSPKEYKSPVDGSRLLLIQREGEKSVFYRDASSGVEYSEKYAKENFEELHAVEKAQKSEKTEEEKAAEKEAKAKKAAEAKAKADASGASGSQA